MSHQTAEDFFATLRAGEPLPRSVSQSQVGDGLRQKSLIDPDGFDRLGSLLREHGDAAELEYTAVLTDEGYRLCDYGMRRYLQAERDSLGVLAVAALLSARKLGQGLAGEFQEMSVSCPPLQAFVWSLARGCVLLNVASQRIPAAILRLACKRSHDRLNACLLQSGDGSADVKPALWEMLDLAYSDGEKPLPASTVEIRPLFVPAVVTRV